MLEKVQNSKFAKQTVRPERIIRESVIFGILVIEGTGIAIDYMGSLPGS